MRDTEWTELVKGFLGKLSHKFGRLQESEQGERVDLYWHEEDRMNPTMAIEHENKLERVVAEELVKPCRASAPLKVLITYVDNSALPTKKLPDQVRLLLRNRGRGDGFDNLLVVLGDRKLRHPEDWWGFA